MSERFEVRRPAAPGDVFAAGATEGLVGQETTVVLPSGRRVPATVVDSHVEDGGHAVYLTLETDEPVLPPMPPG